MEIKLKGREMPRPGGPGTDVKFTGLESGFDKPDNNFVLDVFSEEEVVELVNRAIYQLEYQRESHRKRGAQQRELLKKTKEALRQQGKDVKAMRLGKEE